MKESESFLTPAVNVIYEHLFLRGKIINSARDGEDGREKDERIYLVIYLWTIRGALDRKNIFFNEIGRNVIEISEFSSSSFVYYFY